MTHPKQNSSDPNRLVGFGRHMRQEPVRSHRYRWIALSCVGAFLFIVAVAGVNLLRLRTNVHTASLNIGEYASGSLSDGPLDILVIGSDTRAGNNAAYGSLEDANSGARSDVMMLVQVSQNRQDVSVISFPRDLIVDIPKCTSPITGMVYPAASGLQINESLNHGGPGCTVATISSLTGINIDHFMLVDFNAVKALSHVVGGVQVCVTQAIDDSYSGLKLPAGVSSVEGEQALAFLRSRHGYSDGSDTSRIAAQQSFLASLLRKVKSEGTLTNPTQLFNIAEAVTQNVTVDKGLTNPATLVNIGAMFASIDLSKVVFATVPNEPYLYDANKLQLAPSAEDLFERLREDRGLTDKSAPAPEQAPTEETQEPEQATEEQVSLDYSAPITVLNASGAEHREQDIEKVVASLGYSHITAEHSDTEYAASAVYYPAGYAGQAQQIAQKLGITVVEGSASYDAVTVVIGQDFTSGDVLSQKETSIAGDASGQTADQVKCQQSYEY